MVKRLIDCNYEEMQEFSASQLKESILKSEGRVICGQTSARLRPHVTNVTNMEVEACMGTDMIMVNGYHFTDNHFNKGMCGLEFPRLKELLRNCIGLYLECCSVTGGSDSTQGKANKKFLEGRIATETNVKKALALGANFIVLGGNPGNGTTLDVVVESTKLVKSIVEDKCLIMAGKWEDGVTEKVLGDPMADYDAKEIIKKLIDAGADVITLPAPGSRHSITVECIRDLVLYIHQLGAVALCFLDSSVEGADESTIKTISLWMKQTGADIHCIGDAGYVGMSIPENVYAMSVAIRGRRFTYQRMAMRNRDKRDFYDYFDYNCEG